MVAQHPKPPSHAVFDRARELFLDELLDERQVEREYGLKVGFLRAKRLQGGGPVFMRAGRSVKYRRRAVLAYIDRNTAETTAEADARAEAV